MAKDELHSEIMQLSLPSLDGATKRNGVAPVVTMVSPDSFIYYEPLRWSVHV